MASIDDTIAQAVELARAEHLDAADGLLVRVLAAAPGHPDALQLRGMVARTRGDQATAVALFNQSLAVFPDQPHVLSNLGNALLDLGQASAAVDAYRAALRLQPGFTDAAINLGIALLATGAVDAAVQAEAVLRPIDTARARSVLGRALLAQGQVDAALAMFETALREQPDDVATAHNFAVALRQNGRSAEALPLFERCALAIPQSPEVALNLGHALQDAGRLDAAIDAYARAVANDPRHLAAHDALNRLLWQTSDTQRHLQSYVAAIAQHDRDVGLRSDLARWLILAQRGDEAIALLADHHGDDPLALRRLGKAYWAVGRWTEARAAWAAALARAPGDFPLMREAARAAIIVEDYAAATDLVTPVLAGDPHDQQALAYQGLCWRLTGDTRADWLNDHRALVHETSVPVPADLADVLHTLHVANQAPLEQTMRGGTQTVGELFDRDEPAIVAARAGIEAAITTWVAALPDDDAHPFLSRKVGPLAFAGSWSVRLRRSGYHMNHLHPEGWISAVYYVAVPDEVADDTDDAGWLTFGETPLQLGAREACARTVRPAVGKLVLFPSYVYHGTRPFESDDDRLTIAFDVVPPRDTHRRVFGPARVFLDRMTTPPRSY